MKREIAMATAKINAPDTIGIRAVQGQGCRHRATQVRGSEEGLASSADREPTDVGENFRDLRMFENLNMRFRVMLDKSNIVVPVSNLSD